jgi:hypothetical protein
MRQPGTTGLSPLHPAGYRGIRLRTLRADGPASSRRQAQNSSFGGAPSCASLRMTVVARIADPVSGGAGCVPCRDCGAWSPGGLCVFQHAVRLLG